LPTGFPGSVGAAVTRLHLPARRTAYYLAEGLSWDMGFQESVVDGEGLASLVSMSSPARLLRAGTIARERWNRGPLGPSMGFPPAAIRRTGDVIGLDVPSYYSDQTNHFGTAWPDEVGQARLFRDGTLIGEAADASFASFTVPPEAGDYRLEVQSMRGAFGPPPELSTRLDLVWSFRSAAGDPPALPVASVRFLPPLDDRNRAPAGGHLAIPLALSRQTGAPFAPLCSLGVDVSHDRGATWERAAVVRIGDWAVALVRHPREGAGTSRAGSSACAGVTGSRAIPSLRRCAT
jgi:hypothetical protein